MKKLFLDTNIVIDILEERKQYSEDAVKLFTMAYYKKVKLIVSPITYSTAAYLLRKHGVAEVRRLLSNFRRLSHVAMTNEQVVDNSLASQFEDIEDAIQYYTAIKSNADIIITRNGKDFVHSRIPVMTADEYVNTFTYPPSAQAAGAGVS